MPATPETARIVQAAGAGSLPADLTYGRDGLWVRSDGEVLTVGAAAPLLERAGAVYMVRLPVPGRDVAAREPVGFLETAAGTLDLCAPVAGTVVRVNATLDQDPARLAREPYGSGWLFRLAPARRTDLATLLTAAEARELFRIRGAGRAKGDLRITARFERPQARARWRGALPAARPWWTSLVGLSGGAEAVRGRLLAGGRNEVFSPEWAPGDSWRVRTTCWRPQLAKSDETEPYDETTVWLHEVLDPEDASDGAGMLHVLRIHAETGNFPDDYEVRYRARDFTVASFSLVDAARPGMRSSYDSPRPGESFLVVQPHADVVIDHALVPEDCAAEEREVPAGRAGARAFQQMVTFDAVAPLGGGDPVPRMTVEMRAEMFAKSLVSRQVWLAGLPWWSEATRAFDGAVNVRAELIA